ncbi:MAG: PrsW family glutamic-type intramembrane protease [Candidatus Paceibacterota bacterium]|jgi:RsiW-degrading membrane proteinase PrsW (M82 family)
MIFPDLQTLITAVLMGFVPAVFWLWFWQKEDSLNPEPRGLTLLLFLGGMAAVALVIPLQKFAYEQTSINTTLLTLWASIEELAKFFIFFVIAAGSRFTDEPVDYAVNMITVALGFAAIENTLFLIDPIQTSGAMGSLLTGNLRFIGATVLHISASALLGLAMGLAFFDRAFSKLIHLIFGLITAITLHTLFNFFIMNQEDQNIFVVFGFLWVVAVIVMLLFEKVKNIKQLSIN